MHIRKVSMWIQRATVRVRRRSVIDASVNNVAASAAAGLDDTAERCGNAPVKRSRRKGSALILALIMTVALAGLASSAVYIGGSSQMLAISFDRERDLKYVSEAALAMGKSRLNYDPLVVPSEGYATVLSNVDVPAADGTPVPGIKVNMYIGPTSSNTGQFGRFVSVVTEARDSRGAKFVRRLELAQESFAKFAYWTDRESNMGQPILFGGNDQLWGPVWSNDVISISANGGATFHNDVGTAQFISGLEYGTFNKGYSEHQRPIALPNNTTLANLPGYAQAGGFSFVAPNSGGVDTAMMRIEFVGVDLNGDGKTDGADEGFFRVYKATNSAKWLRGDWVSKDLNCGAFYPIGTSNALMFVPLVEHSKAWFKAALTRIGYSTSQANKIYANPLTETIRTAVLASGSARCFPGGDPHLRAVNLPVSEYNSAAALTGVAAANALGGTPSTFTPTGTRGAWVKWTGTVDSRLGARPDKDYLFPMYRGQNPGTKGVIYVSGTTAISGKLRGRITLYATGNVLLVDDLRYATDPASGLCGDIFGVISGNNIVVADNAIQSPWDPGGGYRSYSDTKDVYIQGIMMALNTSFYVERYEQGPFDANGCETRAVGRGCLYLTGGLIQQARGAVGTSAATSGTGFVKRYSYDRCALYNPPPYFPTTGRYTDNRYYEVDPVRFDVATLFKSLMP